MKRIIAVIDTDRYDDHPGDVVDAADWIEAQLRDLTVTSRFSTMRPTVEVVAYASLQDLLADSALACGPFDHEVEPIPCTPYVEEE